MKKLIIAAAALAMGFAANAACVNWNVSGTDTQVGYTVLLFTAKPAENYKTVDALTAAAVKTATIAAKGRGKYGTGDVTANADSITTTADFYYAIVDGNDAEEFQYYQVTGMGSSVYNLGDTPKAAFDSVSASTILGGSTGTIGDPEPPTTPEPTSGLLMLLGMAGLALRRKQK